MTNTNFFVCFCWLLKFFLNGQLNIKIFDIFSDISNVSNFLFFIKWFFVISSKVGKLNSFKTSFFVRKKSPIYFNFGKFKTFKELLLSKKIFPTFSKYGAKKPKK